VWQRILTETKARTEPASDEARASGEAVVVEESSLLERASETIKAWRDWITSPIAIEASTGDPVEDERRRRERSIEALGKVGEVGQTVSEEVLAASVVSDVAVLATGKDINERKSSRLWAAISLGTAGIAGVVAKYGDRVPLLRRLFRKADDSPSTSPSRTGGQPLAQNTRPPRPADAPQFSVWKEIELKPGTLRASDPNHLRQGNRQLHASFQRDPDLAQEMERQYPGIIQHVTPGPRGGMADTPPPGLSWHHDPGKPGVLQLVPREHHQAPGLVQRSLHPSRRGGRENWGGGRRRP